MNNENNFTQKNKELSINAKIRKSENIQFGPRTRHSYINDPKHLLFSLSRYKFVAKMFQDYERVLEIGCGDAFGSALVAQAVDNLTATDMDPAFIYELRENHPFSKKINFLSSDLLEGSVQGTFDGIFSLDVLEHIPQEMEEIFLSNILFSLNKRGVFIVGMPSHESQLYASKLSKEGHVNCKTAPELKKLMEKFFTRVFIFSMNDEVLHTGFYPMSHYIFALCVSKY